MDKEIGKWVPPDSKSIQLAQHRARILDSRFVENGMRSWELVGESRPWVFTGVSGDSSHVSGLPKRARIWQTRRKTHRDQSRRLETGCRHGLAQLPMFLPAGYALESRAGIPTSLRRNRGAWTLRLDNGSAVWNSSGTP